MALGEIPCISFSTTGCPMAVRPSLDTDAWSDVVLFSLSDHTSTGAHMGRESPASNEPGPAPDVPGTGGRGLSGS